MDQSSRPFITNTLPRLVLVAVLVFLAAAFRLLPESMRIPNVAPVGALALFAGYCLPDRRLALFVPVVTLALSDLIIGTYFAPVMFAVYACFLVSVLLGRLARPTMNPVVVFGLALLGAVQFYLVTNLSVWYFAVHDATSLSQVYTDGLPFFRNSVLGDIAFATVFFGGFALLERGVPALREPAAA